MTQSEMFPEPRAVGGQALAVLLHLQRTGPLTQLEALRLYGVGRLAAVVHALKRDGHRITSEMVMVEKAGGGKARVAAYRVNRS